MSFEPSFGTLDTQAGTIEAPSSETTFRIAILADLSGRAGRVPAAPDELAKRKMRLVDPESFDDVFAAMGVKVHLEDLDGGDVDASFSSLDDLHPDALYSQVDRLSDLDDRDERTAYLKSVLRHPHFRPLEAAWRGVDWLMRRSRKPDCKVEMVLYDLTREELTAALDASDDLTESPIYKLLIEQATQGPKGKPWAVFVGDYTFEIDGPSAQTLGRMAKIAAEAAAPFLTTVTPAALDKGFTLDDDTQAAWTALRRLPEAALLGVALPRFLLRLPYGENTRPIERFSFEEYSEPADRAGYLWGNPAHVCAALLAQAFLKDGWAFTSTRLDLGDMPLHTYRDEDDDEQVTLLEAWLDRKGGERLAALGLMPLLGVKGRDAVQLVRLNSLALPGKDQPPCDLLGRWGQKGAVKVPRSGAPVAVAVTLAAPTTAAPPSVAPPKAKDDDARPTPARSEEAPSAPSTPAADSDLDPELAALLGEIEGSSSEPEESPAPPPAATSDEMDPELAALLGEMESSSSEPAASPEAPAAAEEEMDPELAALLKQMEES